jgi:hypothetical protein
MKAPRANTENLEVGDIFYLDREWEWCEVKEILGVSFFSGRICFGLEPTDLKKPKRYIERFLKMNKSVRLYD